jgi:hypothetical protein
MERPLLQVSYDKSEMDFGVNGAVSELSYEEMKRFREMIVVAIGIAEDSWRKAQSNTTTSRATEIKNK